jgi:hypothetical protein
MTLVSMRVTVRDEPGALGGLATSIGDLGGNIADVDVHELDGVHVVDELVIEVPDDVTPGEVRLALLDAGAVSVVSTAVQHRGMDALVRCLDAVRTLVGGRESWHAALAGAVTHLVSASEVRVVEPSGELAREAFERGVPVARLTAGPDGSPRWALAVTYPEAWPRVVVVVERSGTVRFSATEIARVRALLRLQEEIDEVVAAAAT